MSLLLPSYQGAVQMRLKAEMAKAEENEETPPSASYRPPEDNEHLRSHLIAQQQPVISAAALEKLVAPAPGVDMYGTVSQVHADSTLA
jgi:hypothetical protein